MKSTNKRLQALEDKLLTPENFSVKEYLNFGEYSVVSHEDRLLILEEFEQQTTAEQQRDLSILWAMQPYRSECKFAWHITCGKRTYNHEKRKGRDGTSVHLWGATDFTCLSKDDLQYVANLFKNKWIGGFKFYGDKNFIHGDIYMNRRW